jgi:hypothetical protein
VVIAGEGKNFCAGIDVGFLAGLFGRSAATAPGECPGQQRLELRRGILKMQVGGAAAVHAGVHGWMVRIPDLHGVAGAAEQRGCASAGFAHCH